VIVPFAHISTSAWRKVPAPLSKSLVTVMAAEQTVTVAGVYGADTVTPAFAQAYSV
jgi:hypothetical protein